MFDIVVENPIKDAKDSKLFVYQNSWGLSTRTIGVMVMIHGDDQGLVIPPRVALQQVVIVPVGLSKGDGNKNEDIYNACKNLEKTLLAGGIRAKADLREGYTPGWKFNDWEMRGVPLRLELGPRDIAANSAQAVRRYDNHKFNMPLENIQQEVKSYLEKIQVEMLERASERFKQSVRPVTKWEEIVPMLDNKCAVVIPWCEQEKCEDDIKDRSKGQ